MQAWKQILRRIMSTQTNQPIWGACVIGDRAGWSVCLRIKRSRVSLTPENTTTWSWPSVNSTSASSFYRTTRTSTSPASGKFSKNMTRFVGRESGPVPCYITIYILSLLYILSDLFSKHDCVYALRTFIDITGTWSLQCTCWYCLDLLIEKDFNKVFVFTVVILHQCNNCLFCNVLRNWFHPSNKNLIECLLCCCSSCRHREVANGDRAMLRWPLSTPIKRWITWSMK